MTGYLGLGSNEGDRLANLRAARAALERQGIEVSAASSVYETAPQGERLEQADFLNACLRVETELSPEELLDACKEVERELGRAPGGPRHGPRPHPEVTRRRFVLEPLLELDRSLRLPDGTRLAELLESVADQRVEPTGGL